MSTHTKRLKLALVASALLGTAGLVTADNAERFVTVKGFKAVPTENIEGDRYYSAARFPNLAASASSPDADLSAPVRALLLLEGYEGALPHARYLVNFQPTSEASSPDDVRSYLDITRFNLGPAVHADLVESVPPEHLANVKTFGVGPHVRWRFAMSPRRGMTAGLDAAARSVVSAKDAAAMDCLGKPCTTLESAEGPKGAWKPQRLEKLAPSFSRSTPQGPAPASVLEQLLAALGEDAQRAMAFAPNAQRLVFVVSRNAGGQEHMTAGLARNALVFDDAIGTQWVRTRQVEGLPPDAQRLSQKRK